MDRQKVYDFLIEMFPGQTFCIEESLWYHNHCQETEKVKFEIDLFGDNNIIFRGSGDTYRDALLNTIKDMFKHKEEVICHDQSSQ